MRNVPMICLIALVLGCGAANYTRDLKLESDTAPSATPDAPAGGGTESPELGVPAGAAVVSAQIERKIIYSATVELQVEQFDGIPEQVASIVDQHEGYIARSEITGTPGQPRRGHWTARIPVARYEAFLSAARGLGEVHSVRTDSQDVSEEYYDVEARIRNKKRTEERLLKHVEEKTVSYKDTLEVERELDRIGAEIDTLQGRLQYLKDRTELTTVELIVQEVTQYRPEEAATFGIRVRRAWKSSLQSLADAGQQVLLAAVFIGPWLVVLVVIGGAGVLCLRPLWRRLFRRRER